MSIDQAEARRRVAAAQERLQQIIDQVGYDTTQLQTSWSDTLTRLGSGLVEVLDIVDPLDPADAEVLRHRPTYPPPQARPDRLAANRRFAQTMYPDLGKDT